MCLRMRRWYYGLKGQFVSHNHRQTLFISIENACTGGRFPFTIVKNKKACFCDGFRNQSIVYSIFLYPTNLMVIPSFGSLVDHDLLTTELMCGDLVETNG